LPAALALALLMRKRRTALLALIALPALDEWRRHEVELDPLRFTALALADDAASGAGVLWGAIAARELAPLIPALRR
jgi:hypothetical protein